MFEEDENFKGISFQMDITKKEDIERPVKLIQAGVKDKGLQLLFNNAGIGYFGPIEWLSEKHFRRTVDVNLWGHINVTKALLPKLKTARGRIINTSSVLGRVSMPITSTYHISKYALKAFSDSLRYEMREWGVNVHIIKPGFIRTDFYRQDEQQLTNLWDEESIETQLVYGEKFFKTLVRKMHPSKADKLAADPTHVINAYIHARLSSRPKLRYLIGKDAHLLAYTIGMLPTSICDCILRKLYRPIIPNGTVRKNSKVTWC